MFEKDTFSNILSNINSSYSSMTDFAKKANLDRTYISKYINKKLKNPPTPKILEKIANASNGITTYESLMRICGYFGNIRGDRLKGCRLRKNLSLEEVANKIGTTSRQLSLWENGHDYNLDIETTLKLSELYNVDFNWLAGSNINNEGISDNLQELNKAIPLSELNKIEIPVLGIVKAGYDYLADENIIGHVFLDFKPSDPENYYALQVTGDSMEPLFSDGDIAIVHKQDSFDSGNTCIVLINGDEATVKKVVRMDDGIDLIAMNPYYPVRHFNKNEMDEIPVKVIGKVIEARKRKIFE